jgi:predicted restriction endonuclease
MWVLHVNVCHKRPVSDFPDDAKISEINDINNLIGFCKNHHWEFDNGYLIFDKGVLQENHFKSE